MKEGDYSTELIGIEEGTADVIRDGNTIASLAQGDVIGEMGLLTREPRNASVIATSPMRVLKLTHWEVKRMSADTVKRIEEVIQERRQAGGADPAHTQIGLRGRRAPGAPAGAGPRGPAPAPARAGPWARCRAPDPGALPRAGTRARRPRAGTA